MTKRQLSTKAPSPPEPKIVAVLFSDVAGYSTLTEAQLPTFMNLVLRRISDILDRGLIRERILELNTWGDAIILVSEDISLVARFALDLRDMYRNENWAEHNLPVLNCRTGLHSGSVFVGEDPLRRRKAFFGTQITLTARIEPITPVGQVFATDAFVSILKQRPDPTIKYYDAGVWSLAKAYGEHPLYLLLRHHEEPMAFVPPATDTKDVEKGTVPAQVLTELDIALQTKASEVLNLTAQLTHKSRTLDSASSFMRRVICYNQGEYAQYNFLAAELHKVLRISSNDVAIRQAHCDLLEDSLNTNLERVAQRNFQFIITEYFLGRHEINPRVCIKANHNEETRTDIVQVVRSNKVSYLSEYPVDEHSGFQFVKRHGLHFLCNNIPEGVANGTYENARIYVKKARAYWQKRTQEPTTISHGAGFAWDEEWVNCWETPGHANGPIDQTSCYKSSL